MLDTEIEVFRAGTKASRGITADRLASVASFDCTANPVAICIGHPKSDTPAHGTIAGFRLDGNKLFAKLKGVTNDVVEGIKSGKLLNRSMAFFGEDHEANPTPGKLAPRHLGFLGASAPGIPGMSPLSKALAFAAGDDDNLLVEGEPAEAVVFDAPPTPALTIFEAKEAPVMVETTTTPPAKVEPTPAELAFKAREDAFAARVKAQFEAANNGAVDTLVREGKVLPAEADNLKLAFNSLDPEAEPLTFGAGDKATTATAVSTILSFMASALPAKRAPIGERLSPSREFTADTGVDKDAPIAAQAGELTGKARKLMETRPGLTFEAAIEEVSGGGNVD
jgi:hypothetical protein